MSSSVITVDAGSSTGPDGRRALWLLAAGALAGLALAGWGLFEASPPSRVPAHALALVNGKPILRSDFRAQVEALSGEPFERSSVAQRREVLQSMLEEELFVQRGLAVGLPDSDPDVRAALAGAVRTQASIDLRATPVTEAQLRALFAREPQRYGHDFDAVRSRLGLDLRRAQQRAAELKLAEQLRADAQLLIAEDAPR